MKTFLTAYSMSGHHYGAYLQANNLTHARELAGRRGLNEVIDGEVAAPAIPHRLAQHIAAGHWLEAAHETAFLTFVGLTSGALTPREVLGDSGLLHELLHLAIARPHHPDEAPEIVAEDAADRARLIEAVTMMARDFEYRVPGHTPSFLPAHVERGRAQMAAPLSA